MIVFNIDEITAVVLLKEKDVLEYQSWDLIAEKIINKINTILKLISIFGEPHKSTTQNVQGYNRGYEYGDNSFYFRVCYHEYQHSMGVAIKFSAQSMLYYKNKYEEINKEIIEIYQIVKLLFDNLIEYDVHLSRVDIYADFINEGLSVNEIYKDIIDEKYQFYLLKNGNNLVKNTSSINSEAKDKIVETIYVGEKNKGFVSLLRIYNKKKEQITKHGVRYQEAIDYSSWVRFENEIHGKYARELTLQLVMLNSKEEQSSLIATCLLNKYSLLDEDKNKHKTTQLISDTKGMNKFYFVNTKYADNSLQKSLEYLTEKAGLISFLYKLKSIDETQFDKFVGYLKASLEEYVPNKDTIKWLNKNKGIYMSTGINLFDDKNGK